ncbi:MAG: hypothetical protein FRX49_09999 [Trebouxia sp. A1-2]|nr:MAG: hypothetical protein FRX49_09999 [Trebouxia sp. A1-2]
MVEVSGAITASGQTGADPEKGWGVRARGNKADACSRGVNQRAGIGAGTSRGVEEKGLGIEGGQTTCLRIKKGGSGLGRGRGGGRRFGRGGDRHCGIPAHLVGSKQEHSRVDAQGSTDEAVDSGIAVVRAEQGQHTAVEALADLGQVEAKARVDVPKFTH